ncbi:hypothetical protein HLH36_19375 [Gluconacetobacter aggeris]|uniref:Uncharacterized protein n=1 Tax=Gluconacetobacter aggeris TaxID=1286186 RepID=A0A7W4IWP9_9PROT|nr:hypothetical protein [Gluconacetobacter aggeris]MBB2170461.1 hypothetical protein [Gluconacetobacter aggeris]
MSRTRTPDHDRLISATKGALGDVELAVSGLTLLLGQVVDTEGDVSSDTVMEWAHALQWLRDSVKGAIVAPLAEIARQKGTAA